MINLISEAVRTLAVIAIIVVASAALLLGLVEIADAWPAFGTIAMLGLVVLLIAAS